MKGAETKFSDTADGRAGTLVAGESGLGLGPLPLRLLYLSLCGLDFV